MPGQALIFSTNAVGNSPPDDAEFVVATLDSVSTIFDGNPVYLHGWVAFTPDADVTAVTLRVRREAVDGTQVGDDVAVPFGLNATFDGNGFSAGHTYVVDTPGNAQNATYVLTIEAIDATDESEIVAVYLEARVN